MTIQSHPAFGASIPEVAHHTAAVNGTPCTSSPQDGGITGPARPRFPRSPGGHSTSSSPSSRGSTASSPSISVASVTPRSRKGVRHRDRRHDLRELIQALDVGPVHLAGQDVAGGTLYRLRPSTRETSRASSRRRWGWPASGSKASVTSRTAARGTSASSPRRGSPGCSSRGAKTRSWAPGHSRR